MGGALKVIARDPPPLSPERQELRQELAAANAKARERRELVSATLTAVARAEEAERLAEDRLHEAKVALDEAKAAEITALVDAAAGRPGVPHVPVSEARTALIVAEDARMTAKEVTRRLRVERDSAQEYAHIPHDNAKEAAAAVIAVSPEAEALFEKITALQAQLVQYGCAALRLSSFGAMPPERSADGLRLSKSRMALSRLQSPMMTWHDLLKHTSHGSYPLSDGAIMHAWETALAALLSDANAPLPKI